MTSMRTKPTQTLDTIKIMKALFRAYMSHPKSIYSSSYPDSCTHYKCTNLNRDGTNCDDPIHKGKFKTTKKKKTKP